MSKGCPASTSMTGVLVGAEFAGTMSFRGSLSEGSPCYAGADAARFARLVPARLEGDLGDGQASAGATSRTKRCFDVTAAAVLLVLLAPLFLVITVAVKLNDGGPVLFRQSRMGHGGRQFRIAKFRTMVVDAEARLKADPALYARYLANNFKLDLAEDIRVNRLGRFLRASSLDELPQLLNVLRGEMSLVGPRPIVQLELAEYTNRGAAGAYLTTRPGITGLWQVSGRNRLSYDHRVHLDVVYTASFSLANDLKILLRTPLAVLRRDGVH